jgi:hypothetical protein
MPRHNEDVIQLGVALFRRCCSDAKATVCPGEPTVWSGSTCEGGGWTTRHRMNEDAMTPWAVAKELGLRSILDPAKAAYEAAVIRKAMSMI